MKIGVLGSRAKLKNANVIQDVVTYLQDFGYNAKEVEQVQDIHDLDVAVVLGGDGAILHAALPAAQKGIKICYVAK